MPALGGNVNGPDMQALARDIHGQLELNPPRGLPSASTASLRRHRTVEDADAGDLRDRRDPPEPPSIAQRGGQLAIAREPLCIDALASGTRLDYLGQVASGFEFFGHVELAAVERNAARQFRALADEIERRGGLARALPVDGAR